MNYNMLNQLKRINDNTCVMVDGILRNKATFERYRVTKKMMFAMVSQGYVVITPGVVSLTDKGRRLVDGKPKAKTQKERYHQRRANGYVSRKVWVHEDNLDRFNEVMREFQ